jgi:hypothetical protein
MAQLHCYLPEETAEQFRQKAKQANLSISKYLALLVKNEICQDWPENYFDFIGSWEGGPLARPEQGNYETRLNLE